MDETGLEALRTRGVVLGIRHGGQGESTIRRVLAQKLIIGIPAAGHHRYRKSLDTDGVIVRH